MLTINNFTVNTGFKHGKMFIHIQSRDTLSMEALWSKIKEWLQ